MNRSLIYLALCALASVHSSSQTHAKRRRLSVVDKVIDVHVDKNTHLDEFEDMRCLEERWIASKDLVIGYGLAGGASYLSDIDLVVETGMRFIKTLLSPETKDLTQVVLNFESFLGQITFLDRIVQRTLHEQIIAGTFRDLEKMSTKLVADHRMNVERQLEFYSSISLLRENVLKRTDLSLDEITKMSDSVSSIQWTIFGVWRAFLRRALKLQMIQSTSSPERLLYDGEDGMLEIVDSIWRQMKDEEGDDKFPISQPIRELCGKLLEMHERTQRLLIYANIVNMVKHHRGTTVAVLLDHQPSCNLIKDLEQYGKCIHHFAL